MTEGTWRAWLVANRASVRLGFLLRVISMGVSTVMSLIWTPLLLRAMGGAGLNGLFLTFQTVTRLGGLGDLGISGAIAIRAGGMVGRKEYDRLRPFLASSRAVILIMAPVLGIIFLALSPFLPGWLDFKDQPGAGSLSLLFQTGAITLFLLVISGYVHSVSAAYGNTTWPILPTLLISQLAFVGHWLLARAGSPLWVQNIPYLVSTAGIVLVVWILLRAAHPWLGELRPIQFDWPLCRELIATSGWSYLYGIGNLIYTSTDLIVITKGFSSALAYKYWLNIRLCDLAAQLIRTASSVSMPKITHWMASREPADRARLLVEIRRLNSFQILLGGAAALGYLVINDAFLSFWVGRVSVASDYLCSPWWQLAFALNLAITVSGDVGIQLAGLCGPQGLRKAGLVVGATALVNLALSILSWKMGSIAGIALATVVAQSLLSNILGWQTCRHLNLPFGSWCLRSWLLPVAVVGAAFGLRLLLPPQSWGHASMLGGGCVVLCLILARVIGFDASLLRHEWASLKKTFSTGR